MTTFGIFSQFSFLTCETQHRKSVAVTVLGSLVEFIEKFI